MMRIAVADDEYWARVTLISMLKELDLPLEIVGEAGNGQEMARMTEAASRTWSLWTSRCPV